MTEEVTPQQLQDWVVSGDYHAALQSLGRPRFEPGDGSWSEWIMTEMHRQHYSCSLGCINEPEQYRNLGTFLQKVALNTMSAEDHERCWLCYTHLCQRNGEKVLPVVYHSMFFDASPMELATTLAQRGDDEGLEIMLYHFGHVLPKLLLVNHLPATLPAYQYARFIVEDSTVHDEWLDQHVQNRFQCTGQVMDWIDLIEHYRPESALLESWKRLVNMDGSRFVNRGVVGVVNDRCTEVDLATVDPVEQTSPNFSFLDASDVKSSQGILLPCLDSPGSTSVHVPVVTPDKSPPEDMIPSTMMRDINKDSAPNLPECHPAIKEEECVVVSPHKSDCISPVIPPEVKQESGLRVSNEGFQEDGENAISAVAHSGPTFDLSGSPHDESEIANSCSQDDNVCELINEHVSNVTATCDPGPSGEGSADENRGNESRTKLQRDFSECIHLVRALIDLAKSKGAIDKDRIVSGLKGLRKRLKQIRKLHIIPTVQASLHPTSNDVVENGDHGTITTLRERVKELENLLSQYQSREITTPPRLDQAGQDTHESTSVDPLESQDSAVESLRDELNKLKNEYEIEKRADAARIRYLQQLLKEKEVLIASHPNSVKGSTLSCSPSGEGQFTPRREHRSFCIPSSQSLEKQVHDLAHALELSEQQRAQALEDLYLEREFYAEKVRSLQRAFRDMMGTS